MKALLGVDASGHYDPALRLVGALRFSQLELTLVHASSPITMFVPMSYVPAVEAQTEYAAAVQEIAEKALDEARTKACDLGLKADARIGLGSAAEVLTQHAEEMQADLVAVTATGSRWSSVFLGSVSRGLAIGCHSSILVAKEARTIQGPLDVVLATDHSEYSERWIRKWLSMRAQGIRRVHIVTAFRLSPDEQELLKVNLPMLGSDIERFVREKLEEKNEALVKLLREWGYEADARISNAGPNQAIHQAMTETNSDLLIMGAQGHGFIDRLLVGSVALHQVVAEPYPVLVVRP
jgi:nucleotide-binding universal stress UspA family protein